MGDYNIDYLNPKEKEFLETILLPLGRQIMNTEQPTRVKGNSQSLIDFIITDLPKSKCFETIVSDTPLRTLKNAEIDHWATSTITSIQMKKKSKVTIKEVYNKTNYDKHSFCQLVTESNWSNFFSTSCPEEMFSVFNDIIENALRMCAPKKSIHQERQKWLSHTSKMDKK